MSTKNEGRFIVYDSKENIVGGKAKLDGRAKGLFESGVRNSLGDISNLPKQLKLANGADKEQSLFHLDKEHIDKLQKENASLLKILADKNKIIELSGVEIQKHKSNLQDLSMNMQKLQLQNCQLAQVNSLMLAELNSGKDRLKSMEHELGCKNSLLKLKDMQLAAKLNESTCQLRDDQVGTSKSEKYKLESVEADRHESDLRNTKRKRQLKSRSYCYLSGSSIKHVKSKEKIENKRVCSKLQFASADTEEPKPKDQDKFEQKKQCAESKSIHWRKQSASFKPEEPEPKEEDALGSKESTENNRCVLGCSGQSFKNDGRRKQKERQYAGFEGPRSEEVCEIMDTSKSLLCPCSHEEEKGSCLTNMDAAEKRPSVVRPSRLAAKKVQCYKEASLNVKMRRPE